MTFPLQTLEFDRVLTLIAMEAKSSLGKEAVARRRPGRTLAEGDGWQRHGEVLTVRIVHAAMGDDAEPVGRLPLPAAQTLGPGLAVPGEFRGPLRHGMV